MKVSSVPTSLQLGVQSIGVLDKLQGVRNAWLTVGASMLVDSGQELPKFQQAEFFGLTYPM
jgi:hypothetical protein